MIEAIGESAVRGTMRPEPAAMVSERVMTAQQERLRAERPVESAEQGESVRLNEREPAAEGDAKFVMEKKRLFFEKYDKNGELILRLPPQKTPVDEMI